MKSASLLWRYKNTKPNKDNSPASCLFTFGTSRKVRKLHKIHLIYTSFPIVWDLSAITISETYWKLSSLDVTTTDKQTISHSDCKNTSFNFTGQKLELKSSVICIMSTYCTLLMLISSSLCRSSWVSKTYPKCQSMHLASSGSCSISCSTKSSPCWTTGSHSSKNVNPSPTAWHISCCSPRTSVTVHLAARTP